MPSKTNYEELLFQVPACVRRVLDTAGAPGASRKSDGSLLTACDLALQSELGKLLRRLDIDYPLLGEEMPPEEQRRVSGAPAYWCLDPLDGTSNFAAGIPLYGTSLALIRAGNVEFGLVYDPVRNDCFHALAGYGAFRNGIRFVAASPERPAHRDVACVDFKRLPAALRKRLVEQPPYASQRNLGSCVLEWCWTALGRFSFYLHGGQRLWDYAAGALILMEAGGAAESLDGTPWLGVIAPGDALGKRSFIAAPAADTLAKWRE